jgi:hypothetical protein
MLPQAYTIPAAVIFAFGGLLACFAGYRLFRFLLGVYGFLLGAVITTNILGEADAWTLTMGAIVGGIVGTVLMIMAYFLGVGLVGAGLAVLFLHVLWNYADGGEVPTIAVVVVAVVGALGALSISRYVVIFGTAVAGSWTLLVGTLALLGDTTALRAASDRNVWVIYPFGPEEGRAWLVGAWFVLALVGVLVQLATTRAKKRAFEPRVRSSR